MSSIPAEEYKEAMRKAICNVCVCFSPDPVRPARCIHQESGACILFLHLDEVVDLIPTVKSDSIGPYTEVLRERVCSKCVNQDPAGVCKLRDSHGPLPLWCILDAYFNLVVGVVEDVQERHRATT